MTRKTYRTFSIATLAIALAALLFSCKKDNEPNIQSITFEREYFSYTPTAVTVSGMYSYGGKIDGIKMQVGKRNDLADAHAFEADIDGKDYTVEITGLQPGTEYHYCYEVDYGFSKPYKTETKTFATPADSPLVKTLEVMALDSTTVRVKCEVVAEGGQEVTERGICFNTYGDPTLDDETMQHTSGGLGQYTLRISGLALSTKYYVRAYAKNASGIGFGEVLEFETLAEAQLPEVSTVEVSNVTSTSATCIGNVASDGGLELIERGVCWSLSANPTVTDSHATATDATLGVFEVAMTGLTPNKTYHARAYATNTKGTAYGDDITFTTTEGLPVVATSGITEITATSAKGGGEVTDQGASNVTERGICWGTSHNPTTAGAHASSGTGIGSYTVSMTNLTPNATYFVRAYATNSQGTAYGSEKTLTTDANLPTVTTGEVSNITQTTARGSGNVTNEGGAEVTERGVCWGTSHNPTISGSHASNGTGTGGYTVNMTSLTANTHYYVRAYAKNSAGVSYGNEVDFTTAQNVSAPTVTTSQVTNVQQTTATGGGNVTNSGGATVTARGICWSTSHNPTTSGSHANSGTGTGSFSVNMTGLTPNTTYYVRAYAINSAGTSYGSEVSFTTQQTTTYTISVAANPSNGGTVSGGGTYQQGQSCTVTASANTGYTFLRWTENGSQVSTNANYTFTVSGNRTLVAQFQAQSYTISVSANPSNGGTVNGGGSYNYGQSCTVTASANSGYEFTNWTEGGSVVSSSAAYSFTVSGNRTLVANFETSVPIGAINGLFTINANGEQVYFSQGNLQYIGSASMPYWKFANNQWDVLGTTTGQNSTSQNVDRDLFGWGTSGWNGSGATYYRPWDTDNSSGSLYGPPGQYNLTGTYANADWGVHNPISNGGGLAGQWQTLTKDEWVWVLGPNSNPNPGTNCRTSSTVNGTPNARFTMATVNDITGVVVFPDSYMHPSGAASPENINGSNASFNSNNWSGTAWTAMEEAGCVFLPAAGFRDGTSVVNVGSYGSYWSASYASSFGACFVYFYDSILDSQGTDLRSRGYGVRLVCPAEN